jgi:3-methyladenine DNA glycosylase AlkD
LTDDYQPYSDFVGFDLLKELMGIITALDERKDPAYEAPLRQTVPSSQKAHATRTPEILDVVADWLRAHPDVQPDDLLQLCEALWTTAWREERIAAIRLIAGNERAMDAVEFELLRRWSGDVDNAEQIDLLAEVMGQLLLMHPRLIGRIEQLAGNYNEWQRRLALVTMIVAGRDFAWEAGLQRMVERMKDDDEPAVQEAITWARREIKQREGAGA